MAPMLPKAMDLWELRYHASAQFPFLHLAITLEPKCPWTTPMITLVYSLVWDWCETDSRKGAYCQHPPSAGWPTPIQLDLIHKGLGHLKIQ